MAVQRPLVCDYLQDHTFEQLEDEHGVCVRPSQDFTKYSLNYDQLAIKRGDRLAEQCRGMVIRPLEMTRIRVALDWKQERVGYVEVVAWPMDRFYNHGDVSAAEVDWSDPGLRVYEKLDGTMVVLYWDALKCQWHAATRSVPEADVPIKTDDLVMGDKTFSKLFWEALYTTWHDDWLNIDSGDPPELADILKQNFDHNLTYVFELTGPHNRVVVRYDAPRVTLLAVRHPVTGEEHDIHRTRPSGRIPRPKTWPLNDVAALVAFVDQADPGQLEGAVVCDSQFRRLKVKNKSWVLSSRAKDLVTSSRRNALEAVVQERLDDIIPLLDKDIGDKLLQIQAAYLQLCKQTDEQFVAWRDEAAGSRKDFALLVTASDQWTPPFFGLWTGQAATTRDWIRDASGKGKLSDSTLDVILSKLMVTSSKDT
jgi:hypothetical protein